VISQGLALNEIPATWTRDSWLDLLRDLRAKTAAVGNDVADLDRRIAALTDPEEE